MWLCLYSLAQLFRKKKPVAKMWHLSLHGQRNLFQVLRCFRKKCSHFTRTWLDYPWKRYFTIVHKSRTATYQSTCSQDSQGHCSNAPMIFLIWCKILHVQCEISNTHTASCNTANAKWILHYKINVCLLLFISDMCLLAVPNSGFFCVGQTCLPCCCTHDYYI